MREKDLSLYNKNNAELCHAKGCRKHKNVISIFRGKFCPFHAKELEKMRLKLKEFSVNGNIHEEMIFRRKEVEFRKIPDTKHLYYLRQLEIKYCNELHCYAGDQKLYKDVTPA